jgi:hypothetical protein
MIKQGQKKVFLLFMIIISICIYPQSIPLVGQANASDILEVICEDNAMTVHLNEIAVYGIIISNMGNDIDTYSIDLPDLVDCCYYATLTTYELTLYPYESQTIVLTIQPYENIQETYTVTVRVTSTLDDDISESVQTFTFVDTALRTIDVTTNQPVFEEDDILTMVLTNIGDYVIEGNPTLEIYDSNDKLIFACHPDCWIPLQPGENFSYCISMDIFTEGKYRLNGWFVTHEDSYFDESSFFVLLQMPKTQFIVIRDIHGGLGVGFSLLNTALTQAISFHCTIQVSGGFFNRINFQMGNNLILEPNGEMTITTGPIIGFGDILVMITITDGMSEPNTESRTGMVYLFYVRMNEDILV